MEKAITTNNNS